jgi:hypothetical protein
MTGRAGDDREAALRQGCRLVRSDSAISSSVAGAPSVAVLPTSSFQVRVMPSVPSA